MGRNRIRRWIGPFTAICLLAAQAPSIASTSNDFRIEGWANAQVLLLAPEARPEWTVESPAEPNKFVASIQKQEAAAARILVSILASSDGKDTFAGRGERYIMTPLPTSNVLTFPIYIVAPAIAKQDCKLRIAGPPQTKPWRFAEFVDFSLQCDEQTVARYESVARAGATPLARRLVSRWIRDPEGSHGYALLLVQETVKATLTNELRNAQDPQRKAGEIRVCTHQDVLDDMVAQTCNPVRTATLLNQSPITAKHLEPMISNRLEKSVFDDFAFPFSEKSKGVSLTATLHPRSDNSLVVALHAPTGQPNVGETGIAGGQPAPVPAPAVAPAATPVTPAHHASPVKRELRVNITNAHEVCPQGKCSVKLAGKFLTVAELGQRIVVDKTVDVEFTDDWTATRATLFSVAKSKPDEDITKYVDKNQLKLSDNTPPYGGNGAYDLNLTLQKRVKTIKWSVEYDPPPQRFAMAAAPYVAKPITAQTDYPLIIDDIPSRPRSYTNYRLNGPTGGTSLPLPKGGLINLPYPVMGKDLADYKIVLSPPRVLDRQLQDLRMRFAFNFGRNKYPLPPACLGEVFLRNDPDVRFKLRAVDNKFSLASPAVKPVYSPDSFVLEFKNTSCDPFPAGAKFEIGSPFDQDKLDIEVPLPIESQAFVAYVAGIEGNDDRYLKRLATYLFFVDDIYKAGYSKDISAQHAWMHGAIFGQSIRDNFVPLQRVASAGQLIGPNDFEKLAQEAYQARHAPESFDRIADRLLEEMTPERGDARPWTLIYLDESFSFAQTCASYKAPIERLKSIGLKRAVIVTLGELDGEPLAMDGNVHRCNLDQSGQFRVYSFPRKMLVDARNYALFDSIKENMKDWYSAPKKSGG